MSLCDSLPEIPSDDVDLGLGFGLRPGSLPQTTTSTSPSSISTFNGAPTADLFTWASVDSLTSAVADDDRYSQGVPGPSAIKARMSDMFGRISEKFKPKKYNLKSDSESECNSVPWTPNDSQDMHQNTGIVSLGTSLRQQKMLYEQDLAEIQRRRKIESHCQPMVMSGSSLQHTSDDCHNDVRDLVHRLEAAQLEVELLRQELEMYESRLSSKEKAIHILKQQNHLVASGRRKSADDAQYKADVLIKQLNTVQFELEYRQNALVLSQQTWIERFSSVSKENEELKSVVDRQSVQLKQLFTDKMLISRERDKLQALINARERCVLDKLSSASRETSDCLQNEDDNGKRNKSEEQVGEMAMIKTNCCEHANEVSEDKQFGDQLFNRNCAIKLSSHNAQLAILGACLCTASPCQCALVATQLAQDVTRLTDELHEAKTQRDEAIITRDAYRIAFEEQLNRNRLLLRQLVESRLSKKSRKGQTSDAKVGDKPDSVLVANGVIPSRSESSPVLIASSPAEDMLFSLVEMINDRSEALAHQRLATNLLAQRTRQLEGRLSYLHQGSAVSECEDNGQISAADSLADIFLDAVESI